MSRFLALCRKEWRLLLRDPHGLAILFLVPAVFILIMSLALRDAFSANAGIELQIAFDNQDGGALSAAFGDSLLAQSGFVVGMGEADLRVIALPGFSELLATRMDFAPDYLDGEAEPQLLRIEYAATLLPQARFAARMAVAQSLLAVQGDYLLSAVLDQPDQADALRYVNDPRRLPLEETLIGERRGAVPTAAQQSVPAWLIFALFFSVIPLAGSVVSERLDGSLLRMRLLDVPPGLLLGARAAAYYVVNLAQMATMLAVGFWLVPLLGGDSLQLPRQPFALWLIGSATSCAALGLALLVAACVRSPMQATVGGGAGTLLLAAIGGVLVPRMVMPPAMQEATVLSPMSWALEGFWDLMLRGGDWRSVLPESAALVALGGACLLMAAVLFRRAPAR